MSIDISVIVPVYNVEAYVEECLRKVMAQTGLDGVNVECLVVDDRGTDKSMEVVERTLADYDGPIKFRTIVREKNGGLSAARNSGIREAKGEYLYFLDSDDLIAPHCLSTLWGLAKKYPGVEIVYGKTTCFPTWQPHLSKDYFDFKAKGATEYCADVKQIHKNYLQFPETAWNKLILRTWLLENALFFKEGLKNEDLHWHLRAYFVLLSYACIFDTEPTYLYRTREESITAELSYPEWVKIRYEILKDLIAIPYSWDEQIIEYFLRWFKELLYNNAPFSSEAKIYSESLLSDMIKSKSRSFSEKLIGRYFLMPRFFVRNKVIDILVHILY